MLRQMGFMVGEMKNPHKDLPTVLNTAMVITIPTFTLIPIAFYLCLPLDIINSTPTLAVVSFTNAALCTHLSGYR
jgi:amino acid transporter